MGGSTWTILGTGAGAIGGGLLGNPWLGAQMGSSIGGGLDNYNVGQNNAQGAIQAAQWNMAHNQQVATYNAQLAQNAAQYEASAAMGAATISAMGQFMGAQISASTTAAVSAYNAQVALLKSEYDANLKETESRLILEAVDLDVSQYERQAAQWKGTATVFYGASGVVIDDMRDTPAQMLLNMDVERDLEIAIMRHNGDIQAGKMMAAAAQGRWEGQVAASQIMFEGLSAAHLTIASGALSGMSALATGALQAQSATYQGQLTAHNIRTQSMFDSRAIWHNAQIDASNYSRAGTQALVNGVIGAAGSYASYRMMTMPDASPGGSTYSPYQTHGNPAAGRAYRLRNNNPIAGNQQFSLLENYA